MDAITLLKKDHKTVEALFKRFEKAGDRAYVEKRDIADRIIEELSMHAAIEEQLFYPATRATVPEVEDIALESIEEHHIVKWVLSEIEDLDPRNERFDAKVTVLIENVRHHVEEEESDYFPKVRAELGRSRLNELGDAMEKAKALAPTHPHPRSPDTPPGNLVVGAAAGVVDRLGDTVSGLAQGGVAAAGDVIARVRGTTPAAPSPKGSSVARHASKAVRNETAKALDQVEQTATRARKAGEATVKGTKRTARRTTTSARAGAKGAATSATKGAKRTVTTAKAGATRTARTAKSSTRQTARATSRAAKG